MEYAEYVREVSRAADATGGRIVTLPGGRLGVQLRTDDAHLVLALDRDSDRGWAAWTEDADGERCCDGAEELIGQCALDELEDRAVEALHRHTHT